MTRCSLFVVRGQVMFTPKTRDLWLKKSSQSEHDEETWRPYDLNHHRVTQGGEESTGQHTWARTQYSH